jgi:hypothetical protein
VARAPAADGHNQICFGAHPIAGIDLTTNESVSDVPGQVSAMPRAEHCPGHPDQGSTVPPKRDRRDKRR